MKLAKHLMAAAALLAASNAQAQRIGTYTGTTADGAVVYVGVAQDPNNSNLEVTSLTFGIIMPCAKSGETLSYISMGLSDGHDIVDHKFSYSSSNVFYVDFLADMTFAGNNSLKGSVAGAFAAFNPAFGHDTFVKQVQRCFNPRQSFTATRGTGAPAKVPTPDLTIRGKDGTTIAIGYQPRSLK